MKITRVHFRAGHEARDPSFPATTRQIFVASDELEIAKLEDAIVLASGERVVVAPWSSVAFAEVSRDEVAAPVVKKGAKR